MYSQSFMHSSYILHLYNYDYMLQLDFHTNIIIWTMVTAFNAVQDLVFMTYKGYQA